VKPVHQGISHGILEALFHMHFLLNVAHFMHLSILIPGGKGAGNGWGFDREFYPHRRAFDKVFCPGAGVCHST
jgi:hypothetical protein